MSSQFWICFCDFLCCLFAAAMAGIPGPPYHDGQYRDQGFNYASRYGYRGYGADYGYGFRRTDRGIDLKILSVKMILATGHIIN